MSLKPPNNNRYHYLFNANYQLIILLLTQEVASTLTEIADKSLKKGK